jgi:hypothetical protein
LIAEEKDIHASGGSALKVLDQARNVIVCVSDWGHYSTIINPE